MIRFLPLAFALPFAFAAAGGAGPGTALLLVGAIAVDIHDVNVHVTALPALRAPGL